MKRVLKNIANSFGVDILRFDHSQRMGTDSNYALQQLIPTDSARTIFDLGANLGQTAKSFRRLFPLATIHSFEPSGATYSKLHAEFIDDPNVKTWKLAISDDNCEREFFINSDPTTNSLFAPSDALQQETIVKKLEKLDSEKVKCQTLDSFCAEQGITEIDLLKMDIQGAEVQAIKGGENLFHRQKIQVVFCEVMFAPLYKDACTFSQLAQLMRDFNYTLYGLYNFYHYVSDGLLWGDAIFISQNMRVRTKTLSNA